MEQLDNIFKRLSTDEMQPSQKVWEAVHANQQKKRNRLFWWMGSGALLLAICFYVLYPNSRTSNSSLNQTDTNPLAVRDIPNQKSVKVSNKNLNISNQSTEVIRPTFTSQTSAKHTAFSAIRHTTNKNRISSKHITASDNINANKEAVNEDKKKVNISTNTEKKEMEQPETSAYMTEAPVASANDSFNIPNKEDYVEKKLVSPVKKKVEKSPYKKYINVSTLMAKTYRKLSTDNQAFESYKDLRNLNEISSNQVGIKVELGIVFNKHFSFEGGLMYLPNKISSNYTWQNVKSTEVFDSTINRISFDQTTSTWVMKTDSISHIEKKSVTMNSNGDLKFNYLRIPFTVNYEIAVKKVNYYIGLGTSLNIVTSTAGSIRNFELSGNSTPIEVQQISKNSLGLDLQSKIGARIAINDKINFNMGFNYGYNIINSFKKDYPLKQHNFWYGIEAGLRFYIQ